MRKFLFVLICSGGMAASLQAASDAPASVALKRGDRLAICGDSITEQKIYSRLMEDYLTACTPELEVRVRQYGWGGERADGFLKRMTNDCLRFKPTVATTCYGMNDHEYRPYENSIGEAYERYSRGVVESFKANGVRVVQGSPGCVGNRSWWQKGATTESLNENLGRLRDIAKTVAAQEQAGYADVFTPMHEASLAGAQKYGPKFTIAGGDGVHPGWAGHTIMAYAFLKALGVSGEIAEFTLDLKADSLKVSEGHKVLSGKDGAFEIRSSRYPFCPGAPVGLAADWFPTIGFDSPTNSDSIRAAYSLIPFNDELNRFRLTVKGGTAEKYRVSWGGESKVFTASELGVGVNLAAEFPLNPFSTRFAMIDAAVAAKQAFETRQIKAVFRAVGDKATMEQIQAQTEKELKSTERVHAALESVVRAAYAPVSYTLKVAAE
jgi:lysophospholipase L1-like esterase